MSAATRAVGERVGVYTVVEALGHGGSGAVYKVKDDGGVVRALKLVDAMGDELAATRLRREVDALQALRHDAVPRVYDAEFSPEEAWVVFEYIPGFSLHRHVQDHGPLAGQVLADMAERIASALQAVHDAGVVHRDVTPANVMMGPDGAYLIDFGLAHEHKDERLTRDGLVSGTAGYVAPEVINGAEPGVEADRWAWAATVVYAMTGEAPFGTGSASIGRTLDGTLELPDMPGASALRAALGEDIGRRPGPRSVVAALRADVDNPVPSIAPTSVVGSGDVAPTAVWGTGAGATTGETFTLDAGQESYVDRASDAELFESGAFDSGQLRNPAPRRPFVILLAQLAGVAIVVLAPFIGAVAMVLGAAIVRTEHRRALALAMARARKGKRRGDAALQSASVPWHFTRAFVEVLPAFVIALGGGGAAGGATWFILTSELVGADAGVVWTQAAALAAGALVGAILMWWGPMSWETRDGANRLAGVLAPNGAVAAAWVVVAVVVISVSLLTLYLLDSPLWWPVTP